MKIKFLTVSCFLITMDTGGESVDINDDTSELPFKAEAFPSEMKIIMLKPALGSGEG